MSASGIAGGFMPPGSFAIQPASPQPSSADGSGTDGVTQSASLLAGLTARLTALAKPSPAATAAAQRAVETSSGSGSSNGASAPTAQPSNQLVLATGSPAASIAESNCSQAATPAVLQLTEAAKQHGGQLVISEVCHRSCFSALQCPKLCTASDSDGVQGGQHNMALVILLRISNSILNCRQRCAMG